MSITIEETLADKLDGMRAPIHAAPAGHSPSAASSASQISGEDPLVFELNHIYTRREIADELRGELQPYLPGFSGRVVAGCFRKDMNPGAPNEVLVGTSSKTQKSAEILANQGTPIPVFMKVASKQWEYRGLFRVQDWLCDKASIERYSKDSGRTDITSVLLLSPDFPSSATTLPEGEPIANQTNS
jgi:hypothetical protein